MVPRLTTPRLTLRPPEEADAPAISAATTRLEVSRWTTRIPHPNPPEAALAHVRAVRAEGRRVWAVEGPGGGLVGSVGLVPHLGYWIAPEVQRQGYALEAAAAVLAHAFAAGLDASETSAFEGNARSLRVLARLGCVETRRGRRAPVAATGETALAVDFRLTRAGFAAAAPGLPLTPAARAGMAAA